MVFNGYLHFTTLSKYLHIILFIIMVKQYCWGVLLFSYIKYTSWSKQILLSFYYENNRTTMGKHIRNHNNLFRSISLKIVYIRLVSYVHTTRLVMRNCFCSKNLIYCNRFNFNLGKRTFTQNNIIYHIYLAEHSLAMRESGST